MHDRGKERGAQGTATATLENGGGAATLEEDGRAEEERGSLQEERGGERTTEGSTAATAPGGAGETEARSREEENGADRGAPGGEAPQHEARQHAEQSRTEQGESVTAALPEQDLAARAPAEAGPAREGTEERGALASPEQQPAAAEKRAPADDLGPRKPGVEHEPLRALLGTWEAVVQFGPSTERCSMRSTLLDGLWLLADFEGQLMESPYYGHNVLGWDSDRRKYVGCWIDSRSTSLALSEGTWDEGSRTMTMESLAPDPMTGQKLVNVTRLQDEDHHVFSMHPGSPEAPPVMTITYTRRR